LSFGHSPGDKLRLSVREDIPLENALGHASQHLSTAALTAFEVAGRCPPELQSLTHSIVHQLEIAKALVEASIAGINGRSSG
jgi:ABC-type transport system involved in cytochrome c biogenesis ATPase subunit